jgi:hypothetical protein
VEQIECKFFKLSVCQVIERKRYRDALKEWLRHSAAARSRVAGNFPPPVALSNLASEELLHASTKNQRPL